MFGRWIYGRGERIRTSGLYVPNVALYQAKLHPVDRIAPICACNVRFSCAEPAIARPVLASPLNGHWLEAALRLPWPDGLLRMRLPA